MNELPRAVAIASVLSLVSFASLAQDDGLTSAPEEQIPFDSLDKNDDKFLSHDEAWIDPNLSDRYNSADRDQDGYISQSEFSAFELQGDVKPPPPVSFESLDTNRDGSLSPEEARTDPILSQEYPTVDRNQDGAVDPSEFSAFENKPSGAMGEQQKTFEQVDTNKDGWISRQEYQTSTGAAGGGQPTGATLFERLDANKDGSISKNEANADATMLEQFTSIDSDQNGFITRSEFSAFEAAQKTPSGQGGTTQ